MIAALEDVLVERGLQGLVLMAGGRETKVLLNARANVFGERVRLALDSKGKFVCR